MSSNVSKPTLLKAGIAASVLLLASGLAMAQSAVTLSAGPTTTTLPDGQAVPMWGYTCGDALAAPVASINATCTAMNGSAQSGALWQPPLIIVPSGQVLTITLVNHLSFAAGAGTNTVPTSLVIVGQMGGGLGDVTQRTTMPSPTHAPQGTTWPGTLGGTNAAAGDAVFTPPAQADRVRSFGTEVAVADGAGGKALVWSSLRPGTYLIESGTEPSIQGSMGLYGVLVVAEPATSGGAAQAYGTTFDKDVALLLSEIDPVQNTSVDLAVRTAGFSDTLVWNGQTGQCGDPAIHTCYPPAVNYSPLYYLVNGLSFDRTNPALSSLAVPAAGAQAHVLLRFVNAGLRMHVPTVVGSAMTLLAEDGNKLPGNPRVQSEVLLAAGKTYDVTIQPKQTTAGTYDAATYAIFDRALGLSTSNQRDGGMQAYVNVAGGATAGAGSASSGVSLSAGDKTYYCVAGTTLSVADPSKGLLSGAIGANGAALGSSPIFTGSVSASNLSLQSNGTFTYIPPATGSCAGSFTYLVNGTQSHLATITECDASVQGTGCSLAAAPVAANVQFISNISTRYASPPPGVLVAVTNTSGLVLTAATTSAGIALNPDGSFAATGPGSPCPATLSPAAPAGATCVQFPYRAKNAQGTLSNTATATVVFLARSNLAVNVYDAPSMQPGKTPANVTDYRWIIEEDKTFWIDPKCQVNSTNPAVRPASCPPLPVESIGYNFHTANMPVVAQGCVGAVSCESGQTLGGTAAVCDIGNGVCRTDASQQTEVSPGAVHLDPNKRYFISILPGDGVNPTIGGAGGPDDSGKPFDIATACGPYTGPTGAWKPGDAGAICGHAMGGAQIAPGQTAVNIGLQETPLPTAKIAVFVFQDDNPLNGENDAGGGVDIIAPNEPGLGGFEVKLFDQAGGLGDATGQITYDMFNQPVSNSLAGKIDPVSGLDACPITQRPDTLVGMIPTCPTYESDGTTMSPLAGQAVIASLYPGLYEVVATPAADRIARGEEWLQTNTLDGGKPHEAFIKPNEPGYFQEFGPGGFHVSIGFANPKVVNDRKAGLCAGLPQGCNATLNVQVTSARMSRTPDQRIYSSGTYDPYSFTQCYVSVGPQDGADFAFAKCDPDGRVSFTGMPTGDFKLTVFDQWNDIMLDGLVSPVTIDSNASVKEFPVTQWRANLFTRTYLDQNGDGVSQESEPGLALVNTNIRYRDGSFGFFNNTDLNGFAGFNEVFPFMNWLVVETTTTRYKQAGTHSVYDAGGPADCSTPPGVTPAPPCSSIAANIASTKESVSLPPGLRVPGAVYCSDADCTSQNRLTLPSGGGSAGSTARIDPPQPWGPTQAWQGLLGQNSFIEFGMKPFAAGENGGITGHVIYASTRPFDDPALSLQLQWEPGVPRVKLNLYRKTTDAFGNEQLRLVDTTTTTSWDDWAQGFRRDANGNLVTVTDAGGNVSYVPNMNCPGQDPTSPFFQTLKDSKQWLDIADATGQKKALAGHSQFKCYDGWSMLNQIQPAPYDGMYRFPSVTAIDPATGKPAASSCSICVDNPTGDGTKMLPAGKYVVEVVVPAGYELVKEEDKNILLGDVYIAPVTQQFAGFGNIFIMPDQAAVNAVYNPNNPGALNLTANLGASPRHEGDTGSIESFWPCAGAERIVPDLNSLFPGAGQAAPFAGARRRLCDRKEVLLEEQASVLAKFYIFSSTHIAGHFTGTITNDFASEFDPFSPQFGEKFGPPNLPVGMRDFTGNEVARVYSDQWGIYDGLFFSSYGVNPPNPTGYVPQMSIACMNDPGPIPDPAHPGQMITDPAYNPAYSNFCYETPFMPGFTAYMDTPVIPTQAFADGYNLPDSEYPNLTPAIASVLSSDFRGPWVSASGHTLTITSLTAANDKVVQNPTFSGPNAATEPYNQKTIARHYGFGARGPGNSVTIAGVNATINSWSDQQIVVTVPAIASALSATGVGSTCFNGTSTTIPAGQTPPQRGVTGALLANYRCGQLVITAANGKKSIDAITVTVAGKTPTLVTPTSPSSTTFGQTFPNPLQTAIDNAAPGDLIIVGPGTYRENLIMWKPLRLQGVGAWSVTINADAHPAGRMDPWRRQVNCLFGLTLDGTPYDPSGSIAGSRAQFDPDGTYTCPAAMYFRSDRIPFEGYVGWDAASNGNLAQVLQEPSLMGAYEGAGITVVGRGIRVPDNSTDLWGQPQQGGAGAGTFPDGSTYLTNSSANCTASTSRTARDYGTANFLCNPSRIDGVSIINSSQGGGAIFMHGWNHYMEIANTRISGNHGTLTGGINLGDGETPPLYTNDGTICNTAVTPAPLCPPFGAGSLIGAGTPAANAAIPFQLNVKTHVHHNMIIDNASIGDALFSGTPSGAGGITVSAGADNYVIDHNWIAGNLSTGDAGGIQHAGVSFNGRIANNWILFNQTTNPTLPTNGGGLSIVGANSDRILSNGQECGTTTDVDCPPGIGDGVGPGLVVDANLILGNSAESGSGGGLRLQQVNGSEVGTFPLNNAQWYDVTVTNNVIANNVAGWDGGGVSMQDALKVTFVNNTVVSNDTTASAGVLFKTLGAINSSAPPPGCVPTPDPSNPQNPLCLIPNAPHDPQPAGLVTMAHTPNLIDSLPEAIACPAGFGYSGGLLGSLVNADCRTVSKPALTNDMFWQNRAFRVDIVSPGSGLQSQQNLIALTPALNQTATGQCTTGANYWDVGARGDVSPTDHSGGGQLTLNNSILTSAGGVLGSNNFAPSGSPVVAQYCNGARVPPEHCTDVGIDQNSASCKGYNAPPGRSETTGLSPVFVFNNITPAATVDEGHNWLNLTYGPLTLSRPNVTTPTAPELMVASANAGATGGAYSIAGTSAAVNRGTNTGLPASTASDFFGNPRARSNANPTDIGAVEFQVAASSTLVVVNPAPLAFSGVVAGSGSNTRDLVVSNNGATTFTLTAAASFGVVSPSGSPTFSRGNTGSFAGLPPNCPTVFPGTLAAGASCTIRVQWTAPTTPTTTQVTGSVAINGSAAVTNSPVTITANAVAATRTASVSPGSLAFANWATGTTSAPMNVTLTNTGNSALTALAYAGPAAPFSRVTTGTFPANAPNCTATLAVGASCTVKMQFAPAAVQNYSGTLTISGTGATITPPSVALSGRGVATRATASITPNPMAIALLSPDVSVSGSLTSTGTVTLTNTCTGAACSQIAVTSVVASGGTVLTYFFTANPLVAGPDTCTGAALAPGASCTVTVRFTNFSAPRGVNRTGTITFSDTAQASPQVGALIGFAAP